MWLDEESVRTLNDIEANWQKRATEGMALMCLEAAGKIRRVVQSKAPVLELAGMETVNWADELTIDLVGDPSKDGAAVAIVFKNRKRLLLPDKDVGDGTNTVLIVIPKRGSGCPPWVSVLSKWGPWPMNMPPAFPERQHARIIARRVRDDEAMDLRDKLLRNKAQIEFELRAGGLPNPSIDFDTPATDGLEVTDDLGYAILRQEFGFDGSSARPAWRPALMDFQASLQSLGNRFVEYVLTGKRVLWDIPDHGDISEAELEKYGSEFQDKIIGATLG